MIFCFSVVNRDKLLRQKKCLRVLIYLPVSKELESMANGNGFVFLSFCGLESIISTVILTVSKERWLLTSNIQGFLNAIIHINLSHPLDLFTCITFLLILDITTKYFVDRALHIRFINIPQIMCIASKDLFLG